MNKKKVSVEIISDKQLFFPNNINLGEHVEEVALHDYEEFREGAGHRGEAYNSSDEEDEGHEGGGFRQAQCQTQ